MPRMRLATGGPSLRAGDDGAGVVVRLHDGALQFAQDRGTDV